MDSEVASADHASEHAQGPWGNPKGTFNNIFVVRDGAVVYGKIKPGTEAETSAQFQDGKTLKAIPFDQIQHLRANKRNHEVKVKVGKGKDGKAIDLELGAPETQGAFMQAAEQMAGPGWKTQRVEVSRIKASIAPVIAAVVVAGLTTLVYGAAQTAAEGGHLELSGRRQGMKKLLVWLGETLGTTGTLVVGGIGLLVAILFLVSVIKNPPVYDELKKR